ncbi:MAG: aspartate carbamoyltransferase [Lachnospiraceae bacterium]|nr:aspartate carbamoyltransferase [Lachnospiraceae bacterium]
MARSINDIVDLSVKELDDLIDVASDMMKDPQKYAKCCEGKVLATVFFEPSTRTRLSFESAMYHLGGSVLSVPNESSSSSAKGESVSDTARVISGYADIFVMRNPKEGSSYVAGKASLIPFINAGDGGHNHPTQTLADLMTIKMEKGRFNDLTVGICGDLRYGRTVHSLINALSRYSGVKFILISPQELGIPDYVRREILEVYDIPYEETEDLVGSMPKLDLLYMTRIQRERFEFPENYDRLKDSYILDMEKLGNAKDDMIILHPLPRVNEISIKVDEDPRACYFKQALYGRYMRQALILKLLNEKEPEAKARPKMIRCDIPCKNQRCISQTEQELEHVYKLVNEEHQIYRCLYCESKLMMKPADIADIEYIG